MGSERLLRVARLLVHPTLVCYLLATTSRVGIAFTWDARKDKSNVRKHGVSFAEASTAFADPLSLTIPDPAHSVGEERFVLVGLSAAGRLLVVVHVDLGEVVRIISAREATRRERRDHEEKT